MIFKQLKRISIAFLLIAVVITGFSACQKELSRSKSISDPYWDGWTLIGAFSTVPGDEYAQKLVEIGAAMKKKYPDTICIFASDQATDKKGNPVPNMRLIYYRLDWEDYVLKKASR